MSIQHAICLTLGAALIAVATPASAQKMYRCGSVYQDRPCGDGRDGKVISGGGVATSTAATSTVAADAECAKRGSAAQKIKWVREAGKTEEQQMAAATSRADRDLVADVYRRQGTSGQVRSAVEADCMAEKERAAQAAALIEAANKLQGTSGGNPGQASAGGTTQTPGAADTPAASGHASAGSNDAGQKRLLCERLNKQLATVRGNQRSGGDASRMDALKQQNEEVSKALRDAGC